MASFHPNILYFYDEPLIFIIKYNNTTYLFIRTTSDDIDEICSLYLVSEISNDCLTGLKNNKMTVYEAVYNGLKYLGYKTLSFSNS